MLQSLNFDLFFYKVIFLSTFFQVYKVCEFITRSSELVSWKCSSLEDSGPLTPPAPAVFTLFSLVTWNQELIWVCPVPQSLPLLPSPQRLLQILCWIPVWGRVPAVPPGGAPRQHLLRLRRGGVRPALARRAPLPEGWAPDAQGLLGAPALRRDGEVHEAAFHPAAVPVRAAVSVPVVRRTLLAGAP